MRRAEERPGVGGVDRQVRVVAEPEPAPADPRHRRVELDAVDVRGRVVDAECAGGRPGRVAEDRHPPERAGEQRRHREEHVPLAPGQDGVRPPDRMDRHAFVQMQHPLPARLPDHLDVLVARRLLVEQAGRRLHGARRHEHEDAQRHRHDQRPPAEQQRARRGQDRGGDEQGPLRADQRDQDQRGDKRADERARGGERVEAPRGPARLADVVEREPDRERRDRTEQDDRGREEQEHGEERADDRAVGRAVETLDGEIEEGPGGERDEGHDQPCRDDERPEQAGLRPPVGEPPAQPVPDRERGEHEPDQVRPDDRRRAEVRGQQP